MIKLNPITGEGQSFPATMMLLVVEIQAEGAIRPLKNLPIDGELVAVNDGQPTLQYTGICND